MRLRFDNLLLLVALGVSFASHTLLLKGLSHAAQHAPPRRRAPVAMDLVEIKPVVAEPPKPDPPPTPKPAPKPIDLTQAKPKPQTVPPPNTTEPAKPNEPPPKPVFGISMSSVVQGGQGGGMTVRVGNTLMTSPEKEFTAPQDVRPYAPVPLSEVTRAPKVKREVKPEYTAVARDLGIEGDVKLEVEVRAEGTVGEVRVVQGLGYGLDEAAVQAMRRFEFFPAQIGADAVATRIIYTHTFLLDG